MSAFFVRVIIVIAAACIFAACSSPNQSSTTDAVTAREQQQTGGLKVRYKDVITGTDVHDRTLTVYVDVNNMYSMDEQSEAAMKADALATWKRVWSAAHPHMHAMLHLSLRDYYGKEVYAAAARV